MASMNSVVLAGNLTRKPEVRFTDGGTAVAEFGLALNENYKNKAGELVEKVVFVDVTTWGKQAEAAGEYLDKGSPIMLQGRLQLDQWETEKKEKRQKLTVRADRIQFLHRAPASNSRPTPTDAEAPAEYDDDVPF
ncbi:single-stranded DNA-binding protein [Pontiella sp.]|uniref:single-stranded DNA-binding protein n=1 Tax=Pontiella sp. TaxID=2837462 RepID=UPI0035650253